MIVDTDALIDVMHDDDTAKRKIASLEAQDVPLRISAVSQFELYHSIERIDNTGERRRQIEAVLDTRPAYPADSPVMKKARRIDGATRLSGVSDRYRRHDHWSDSARPRRARSVEKGRYFERIDGLDLDTY